MSNMMTPKQEAYAVSLAAERFGNQGRYLTQYKRELASIGIKLRMNGVSKHDASQIITQLKG